MNDLFRIGSATKPFVAVVMLQLVEEGEIALDDPITDYLPSEIVANIANAGSCWRGQAAGGGTACVRPPLVVRVQRRVRVYEFDAACAYP